MDLFLRCVAQRFSFFKKIQNFGPFSKGRGLDPQIFNKTSKIVDLFGKPLGQRSRYFTKDPKLVCGPFSLAHGSEVHDIPQSIQNCGPFFPTHGSEV